MTSPSLVVWAHFKLPPAPTPPEWSRFPVMCACGRDPPASRRRGGPALDLACLASRPHPDPWQPEQTGWCCTHNHPDPNGRAPSRSWVSWPCCLSIVGPVFSLHTPSQGDSQGDSHCGLWQRKGGLREPSQRLWNVLFGSEPIASAHSSLAGTSHLALLNHEGPRTWPRRQRARARWGAAPGSAPAPTSCVTAGWV